MVKMASAQTPPTKSEKIVKLLRRPRGASLAELQKATGWQAHSVRGFISGSVRRRIPASSGSRLPFRLLQGEQAVTTFCQVFSPPRDCGRM